MHGAASLDDLDGDAVMERWVDPAVHPRQLQRRLDVPVDTLHLRLKDGLQAAALPVDAPEDQQLAIPDGDDGDHGVQLAVDPRAVVEHGQDQGRRAQDRRGAFERLAHQRYGTSVRALPAAGPELVLREDLASPQQVLRQQRGVNAIVLDLGDTVRDAQHARGRQGHVRVLPSPGCFDRVRLLVRRAVEAERLVLGVQLRQLLLPALERRQAVKLVARLREEGARPRQLLCLRHRRLPRSLARSAVRGSQHATAGRRVKVPSMA
mmetsp:Transcript_20498/g.58027  ORF Transcript_20498/g.58027 Transcript_20498/m.58027 type:complete len:264 (-) Transcript_20498:2-793(-)